MSTKTQALKTAFPHTLPILTGYLFLGTAWGILMKSKGYTLLGTCLISLSVYAGAMQFAAISLLALSLNPFYAFLMTLMVNARHLFYGLIMLEKFKGTKKLKPYLIFGLTDETFSLLCSLKPPPQIEKTWFMFFLTLLNHLYWVLGCLLGAIIGGLFLFNIQGLDFVLTSLFTVIFIDQWRSTANHLPVLLALVSALLCRLLWGPANFIIPAMFTLLILMTLFQKPITARGPKH